MKSNILIADDDDEICKLIKVYLESEYFSVDKVNDGKDVMELIEKKDYNLIILDIMMPTIDGITTLVHIRKKYNMPVIFLTAKTQEVDTIKGLTLGADDYICKPFKAMELIARVKAQLRRYTVFNQKGNLLKINDLELDIENYKVTICGIEKNLTPTEYKILKLFLINKDKVFTIEEIYEKIWKEKYPINDTSIIVHITNIRSKIEKNPKNPEYIKTIWGVGYKL